MACHPTGILRDEHQRILRVVSALEALLDRGGGPGGGLGGEPGGGPGDIAAGDLRRCVDFFRLYTDALHHGKEEDLLFESLVERGFPRHAGPIAMMLEEHELGRGLVRQMAGALDAMGDDSGAASARPPATPDAEAARRDFEHAARSYIDLLRRHIMKEDHALFDMADEALDEPACRALCDVYDTVCARRFDGRTMSELEQLADRIEREAS